MPPCCHIQRRGASPLPPRRCPSSWQRSTPPKEAGLDSFGLGEHHRAEYIDSAAPLVLAAAAARTERIRLHSAVTVLSAADPVRIFQEFATLDLISKGRAALVVGRGSFTDAFPLFGLKLENYNELFTEKFDRMCEPGGAILTGNPGEVATKALAVDKILGGIDRLNFQMSFAAGDHEAMLSSIHLLGTEVFPGVAAKVATFSD